MYDYTNLKQKVIVSENEVECPVVNCDRRVNRMKKSSYKFDHSFFCDTHRIFISPSTFIYENPTNNLLCHDLDDMDLLSRIDIYKRESRMKFNNSEDAMTWSVFRFLEKHKLIDKYLSKLLGTEVKGSEIVYWSFSQKYNGIYSPLKMSREEFETNPEKGSEPDIIIETNDSLIIVEAKLTATNQTISQSTKNENKYVTGGEKLWDSLFQQSFTNICVDEKKYELARFWLLGNWMATREHKRFFLINLVCGRSEKEIVESFTKLIKKSSSSEFLRSTWEDILRFVADEKSPKYNPLIDYLENRTVGYDSYGNLIKALMLE